MGCGNSKLNPEGELVPPRIRPLLLMKRKNGTNLRGGTLSKKVLLKERDVEEENCILVDNRKTMSCSPNSTPDSLASQQRSTKQDKNDEEEADQSNHRLEEGEPLPHHPDDLKHNETHLEFKEEDKAMDQHKYECKKAGEEGRHDNNEDNRSVICPGSPSFRVYFVEETKNDKQNVDTGMEDVSHNKSPSHDSVESTTSAKFGEGQENKVIKKGKKGNTFNRVISKNRSLGVGAGVKNLLNVKSCYHLSCSGNDRANLLARKAEA